ISCGVSERISPVPPAATNAQNGYSTISAIFSASASRSRDRSARNGVTGKPSTPRMRDFISATDMETKVSLAGRAPRPAALCGGRKANQESKNQKAKIKNEEFGALFVPAATLNGGTNSYFWFLIFAF